MPTITFFNCSQSFLFAFKICCFPVWLIRVSFVPICCVLSGSQVLQSGNPCVCCHFRLFHLSFPRKRKVPCRLNREMEDGVSPIRIQTRGWCTLSRKGTVRPTPIIMKSPEAVIFFILATNSEVRFAAMKERGINLLP